jgi:hypothetical protein
MATIEHVASKQRHELRSSHLIGRSRDCRLCLDSRMASAEHAVFHWTGSAWHLRDLGSTNGTFVDGRRLDAGESTPVARGARLEFGAASDAFVMIDDTPPRALATAGNGDVAAAEGGILILPDADHPELTIFEDGPGNWQAESSDGQRRRVEDDEEIGCGDRMWRLALPLVLESTWKRDGQMTLADLGLRFAVSRDEEYVEIAILHGDSVIPLQPRTHGFLLLTLARARLLDRDNGLPESEQGWMDVEELTRRIFGGEPNRFHVAVYRAKRQLGEANVMDAARLFERRLLAGQIRLAMARLEIQAL